MRKQWRSLGGDKVVFTDTMRDRDTGHEIPPGTAHVFGQHVWAWRCEDDGALVEHHEHGVHQHLVDVHNWPGTRGTKVLEEEESATATSPSAESVTRKAEDHA